MHKVIKNLLDIEDPIKLHLNYIDREIDLGFYSRNRVINEESSMSVLG